MNPTSMTRNSEHCSVIWVWCNHRNDSKLIATKVVLTADEKFQHNFPMNIGRHEWRLGIIELMRWIPRHNTVMNDAFFERLKGVTWLMKVDRLGSKMKTQMTEWNADKCNVQRWLQTTIIANEKWFPSLTFPSWLMSVSFLFYEYKKGKKHSLYLIIG